MVNTSSSSWIIMDDTGREKQMTEWSSGWASFVINTSDTMEWTVPDLKRLPGIALFNQHQGNVILSMFTVSFYTSCSQRVIRGSVKRGSVIVLANHFFILSIIVSELWRKNMKRWWKKITSKTDTMLNWWFFLSWRNIKGFVSSRECVHSMLSS